MADSKRVGLTLIILTIKVFQMVMVYNILIYDLKEVSPSHKATYSILIMLYCGVLMIPLLIVKKTKSAWLWEIRFSTVTIVVYLVSEGLSFINTLEDEDHLEEEKLQELQNFTSSNETNTRENENEAFSKPLLEIFAFALEILFFLFAILCFLEEKHPCKNPDQEPLEAYNINYNDVEKGIDNDNQASVAVIEPEAFTYKHITVIQHVAIIEHVPKDESVATVEPETDDEHVVIKHVSTVESADAVEPEADNEHAVVIEHVPTVESAVAVESETPIKLSSVDDLPPCEEEVSLMSQTSALKTSPICHKYRRIPYHIPIEDEDDMEETVV